MLRSLDQLLMCNSTITSEDLTEADPDSICAFMCYFFMSLYKYKQCRIVVEKHASLFNFDNNNECNYHYIVINLFLEKTR